MMKDKLAALVVSLALTVWPFPSSAFPGQQWEDVGARVGIDSLLLYAVALAESAKRQELNMISPWPLAIRQGLTSHYPTSKAAADHLLAQLLDNAALHELDIGLMQINLGWHEHRVDDPLDLLDAEANLALGAEILAEALRSAPDDMLLGIGRYHSWQDDRARWYGERVLTIYDNLKTEKEVRP